MQSGFSKAKPLPGAQYQKMFIKSISQSNKMLMQQRNIRDRSYDINERLAMTILNSPNSYGSNAFARNRAASIHNNSSFVIKNMNKRKINSIERQSSISNTKFENSIDIQQLRSNNNERSLMMKSINEPTA